MEEKAERISDRLLEYGVEIISLTVKLRKTATGKHIANQLLRCGTSVGANYEEARGAQSRADFIHKLQLVLKEVRESLFWLKLIQRSKILNTRDIDRLIDETIQLNKIIARSLITAKSRK